MTSCIPHKKKNTPTHPPKPVVGYFRNGGHTTKGGGNSTATSANTSGMDHGTSAGSLASSANQSRSTTPPHAPVPSKAGGGSSSLSASSSSAATVATGGGSAAPSPTYQQLNSASVGRGSKPPRIPLPHLLLRPQSPLPGKQEEAGEGGGGGGKGARRCRMVCWCFSIYVYGRVIHLSMIDTRVAPPD